MKPLVLIVLLACAACAQGVNGIVVSVSRAANLTPDEADFTVVAAAPLDTTQAQVTQTLQDLGAQNPVATAVAAGQNSYTYPPPADSQILYQLAFSAPPSALKDLAKKLDAVRNNLPPTLTSLQFSAALSASQAAVDAAHSNILAQLLSDAAAKAQNVAAAAGLKLGAIQGVAESANGFFYSSSPLFSSLALGGAIASTSSGSGTQYTFSATVTFAVAGQ
jgi:hypothetical protein